MRKRCSFFRTLVGACTLVATAWSHPTPTDDLLRPEIRVTSRVPLSLVVTLRPRVNLISATVETPNNVAGASMQCEYGALVENQTYQCNVTGAAAPADSVLAVNVTGIVVEADGHRHLSSRSLAVPNPQFDSEEFRLRQLDNARRASAQAVRARPQ